MIGFLPPLFLRTIASVALLWGSRSRPLLPFDGNEPTPAVVIINTATHRICLENKPLCWRSDEPPSLLKKAYILHHDA